LGNLLFGKTLEKKKGEKEKYQDVEKLEGVLQKGKTPPEKKREKEKTHKKKERSHSFLWKKLRHSQ